MSVAIVSDVHGSLVALEAVIADLERRRPDTVLHGGDLALMGPQPAEVVDRIRELGWAGVVGNTDELLWRPEGRAEQLERAPELGPLLALLYDAYRPHTREALGDERIEWLRGLPAELRVEGLRVVHAGPGDLWRAPPPDAPDDVLDATYAAPGVAVAAYGHIHQGYARRVGGDLVVANCGSVGLPWDGDPCASYLLVEDGAAEVVRVAYDVERDCALLARSGHPDAERIAAMRRSGRFVAPA